MVVQGNLLIARLQESSAREFEEVLVCCRDNALVYRHFADRILCEARPDLGPLVGLAALLSATQTPLLAVLPCDQLELSKDWLERLSAGLCEGETGVVFSNEGRHTPIGLWRTHSARRLVYGLIEDGARALSALVSAPSVSMIEDQSAGVDADTVDDLRQWSGLDGIGATS